MTLQESRIAIIETMSTIQTINQMKKWGFETASNPGYKVDDKWWAGFVVNDKPVYAWETTPEAAVKQAAILAINETQ